MLRAVFVCDCNFDRKFLKAPDKAIQLIANRKTPNFMSRSTGKLSFGKMVVDGVQCADIHHLTSDSALLATSMKSDREKRSQI
jgi:hypothetical protein